MHNILFKLTLYAITHFDKYMANHDLIIWSTANTLTWPKYFIEVGIINVGLYYSVCNVINVLLMTFYHVTRSSILYVVLCLLAVQMTSTMHVVCYLNVLECELVY